MSIRPHIHGDQVVDQNGDQNGDQQSAPADRKCGYSLQCIEEHLPTQHVCQDSGCQRVVINVAGLRFETQLRTLNRRPSTLLGDPLKRRQYWDRSRQEFFLDRHRPSFQAVLYYYQSGGRLKRPHEVPLDIFVSELQFYELGCDVINALREAEGCLVVHDGGAESEKEKEKLKPEMPDDAAWKKIIWKCVEYPDSSLASTVFAFFSLFFICVSVVTFCVETLPEFGSNACKNVTYLRDEQQEQRQQLQNESHQPTMLENFTNTAARNVKIENESITTTLLLFRNMEDPDRHYYQVLRPNWHDPLFIIESVCICFFVLELSLRAVSCPDKAVFVKDFVNWIDLVAIAPYFIFLGINMYGDTCVTSQVSALRVLRVLRVVRILKLSKHSTGLCILGKTLHTSIPELCMFVLFLCIATVIFSSAIYFAEVGQTGSIFTSIPSAFWWALVTMTTVGYGDYVPVGGFGKLLGAVCVLSGVLCIALPVPVIVANFNKYYIQYRDQRMRSGRL